MRAILVLALTSMSVGAAPAFALTLQDAITSTTRSPKLVARDTARHPRGELAFFGVKPADTVVEIWPGAGYWTQILAPYLRDHGIYYAALGTTDGNRTEQAYALSPAFRTMLDSSPAYRNVRITQFGIHHPDLAPPGSANMVLTFRNLHNWMAAGDAPEMLAAIRRCLKPGGLLGIEDHRAGNEAAQDTKAANGYVREDYAKTLVEQAGFRFAGSSEIDANPRDTKNWPAGVWTLPPTFALGAKDRAVYEKVGEADNFVLKFRKE